MAVIEILHNKFTFFFFADLISFPLVNFLLQSIQAKQNWKFSHNSRYIQVYGNSQNVD